MRRKINQIIIILLLCPLVAFMGIKELQSGAAEALLGRNKTTVRIWYSDEAITDWLNVKAVTYSDKYYDIRIEPMLVSGVELLENINRASLEEENYPDLYITTNDVLEKASLAGLTTPISVDDKFLNKDNFCETALNAVTYRGQYVAYPLFYETSVLLYNKTYLEDFAVEKLRREGVINGVLEGEETADSTGDAGSGTYGEDMELPQDEEQGDETQEEQAADNEETSAPLLSREDFRPQIDEKVYEMIPKTLAELITFAGDYNAPANVEGVFKWDVTDIFYNFFFVGNYMNPGGPAGDDMTQLDLYNSEIVSCMKAYQKLNTYFAIDPSDVSYSQIVQDFISGKMVFTVATSDMVTKIRQAQEDGLCEYEFGATDTPALNDYYATRSMSVTDCLVVNGYSENISAAKDFAAYLVSSTDEASFKQTGRPGARSGIYYEDEMLPAYYSVYAESVPLPKMIETSNYWMLMEIAFTEIWDGADSNMTMKELSEAIMKQVVGRHYEEMLLPEPDAVSITNDSQND